MVTTEREAPRALPTLVDEGFPARTTRTSLLVAAIAILFAVLLESGRDAAGGSAGLAAGVLDRYAVSTGLALGAAINLAAVGLLVWGVRTVVRTPEEGRPRRPALLVAILLLQLPVIGVALYLGVARLHVNVFALAAGLGTWFFVAALKVASILLVGRR